MLARPFASCSAVTITIVIFMTTARALAHRTPPCHPGRTFGSKLTNISPTQCVGFPRPS